MLPLCGCLQAEFKKRANHQIRLNIKKISHRVCAPVCSLPNLLHIHIICIYTSSLSPSYHGLLTISCSSSTDWTFTPLQTFTACSPSLVHPAQSALGWCSHPLPVATFKTEGEETPPTVWSHKKKWMSHKEAMLLTQKSPLPPALPRCAVQFLSHLLFFPSLTFWVAYLFTFWAFLARNNCSL